MLSTGRAILIAILVWLFGAASAFAVVVEVDVESKGEPVPGAEISFETEDGEEIELTKVEEQQPPAEGQPPQKEEPSATTDADSTSEETPATTTGDAQQPGARPEPEPRPKVRVVETDDSGGSSVEIDEEFRDKPVFVIIRRDGEVVERRRVVLSGDPVLVSVDLTPPPPTRTARRQPATVPSPRDAAGTPVDNGARQDDPIFTLNSQLEGGVIDRGSVNLPFRLQFEAGGILFVERTFEVERDDEFSAGVSGDARLALPGGFASAILGGRYAASSTDHTMAAIDTGAFSVGVLHPQGGGEFVVGPTTLTDVFHRSDYSEFIILPGLALGPFVWDNFSVSPRLGALYGETQEDAETTFRVGGFFDLRYDESLETQRLGAFVGARLAYNVNDVFQIFVDPELRFISNDAWGSATTTANLGLCAAGCRHEFSDSHSDIGARIGAGVQVNASENLAFSFSGAFETWQVAAPSYPVHDTGATPIPVDIVWKDRDSLTFSIGMTLKLQ